MDAKGRRTGCGAKAGQSVAARRREHDEGPESGGDGLRGVPCCREVVLAESQGRVKCAFVC